MGNTFGQAFRVTTWGESHGDAVGVTVDGCPPLLNLTTELIQNQLDRRRPGQSEISTQRREGDKAEILSGVFEGRTLGTPISIAVWNSDARSKDYDEMKSLYRPSHADYTYQAKYGVRNWKGGGRSSARETIGRVAAGAIARSFLEIEYGTQIIGYVKRVADIEADIDQDSTQESDVESNIVRCPDQSTAELMIEAIKVARKNGDSLGGIVECVVRNAPTGLGEPVFDKLDAELAKAMVSLPACKGFEIGSGFSGTYSTGSQHNDPFVMKGDRVGTTTNNSGGIQGGISNGEPIIFRSAFKPTATIMKAQQTVDVFGNEIEMKGRGRHDPCVLPRAVPIVEAMASLVLADHALRHRGQRGN